MREPEETFKMTREIKKLFISKGIAEETKQYYEDIFDMMHGIGRTDGKKLDKEDVFAIVMMCIQNLFENNFIMVNNKKGEK